MMKMKQVTSNPMRLLPRLGAILGLFLMSSPIAAAHEQAIAITELTLMAEQQGQPSCVAGLCRVEVAHRFSIHDAESTLLSVLGERPDLGFNPDAQAKFEAYVQGKFSVTEADTGLPVPLSLVGGEVERGFYWVYQEGFAPRNLDGLTITHGALMEVIPTQTNRVNIRLESEVRTLVFTRDAGPQTIRFD
jgi:hypothetical protein